MDTTIQAHEVTPGMRYRSFGSGFLARTVVSKTPVIEEDRTPEGHAWPVRTIVPAPEGVTPTHVIIVASNGGEHESPLHSYMPRETGCVIALDDAY